MKPRNLVAKDMYTNGLYRAQVVKSKKSYQRKQKHKEYHDVNERFEPPSQKFRSVRVLLTRHFIKL